MDLVSILNAMGFILFIMVVTGLLNAFVPVRLTRGYVQDNNGDLLLYRLNGLQVHAIVLGMCVLLVLLGLLSPTLIAENLFSYLYAANIIGLAATAGFIIKGYSIPEEERETQRRVQPTGKQKARDSGPITRLISMAPSSEDSPSSSGLPEPPSLLFNIYTGMEFNPRIGLFDFKMYLYLIGAILLHLIILSALALHYEQAGGQVSNAMSVYVALFSWFIIEYIYCENIHIYTYDIFAEKLGFKLIWGCLFFYPFFYPIGIWSLVAPAPRDLSSEQCIIVVILFLFGWTLTRGANVQKFIFKINPTASFLGIPPRTIPESNILCSGFWGVARHINFLGEILQAVALALPGLLTTGSLLPLVYPLYYVALFIPRQIEDDKICLAKYGRPFEEYMRRVPYRIVPYLY